MESLMTQEQAAEFLNVSTVSLWRWRKKKVGPRYVKFDSFIRYRMEDLEKWLKEHAHQTTTCSGKIQSAPQYADKP